MWYGWSLFPSTTVYYWGQGDNPNDIQPSFTQPYNPEDQHRTWSHDGLVQILFLYTTRRPAAPAAPAYVAATTAPRQGSENRKPKRNQLQKMRFWSMMKICRWVFFWRWHDLLWVICWELTYPLPSRYFWVDGFPFPKVGYVIYINC